MLIRKRTTRHVQSTNTDTAAAGPASLLSLCLTCCRSIAVFRATIHHVEGAATRWCTKKTSMWTEEIFVRVCCTLGRYFSHLLIRGRLPLGGRRDRIIPDNTSLAFIRSYPASETHQDRVTAMPIPPFSSDLCPACYVIRVCVYVCVCVCWCVFRKANSHPIFSGLGFVM